MEIKKELFTSNTNTVFVKMVNQSNKADIKLDDTYNVLLSRHINPGFNWGYVGAFFILLYILVLCRLATVPQHLESYVFEDVVTHAFGANGGTFQERIGTSQGMSEKTCSKCGITTGPEGFYASSGKICQKVPLQS